MLTPNRNGGQPHQHTVHMYGVLFGKKPVEVPQAKLAHCQTVPFPRTGAFTVHLPAPNALPLLLMMWVPLRAGPTGLGPVLTFVFQQSLQAFFVGYFPGAGLAEPHFHLDMGYPQSLPTVRK